MNTTNAKIEACDIRVSYNRCDVLDGISLRIEESSRWAVIGPNGAGKSTLIKIIAGIVRPTQGLLLVNGREIGRYAARIRAKVMAYMPQKPDAVIPYTVYDFVMLGRYSSMGILGIPSNEDREMVDEALAICDIRHCAERLMNTLSGGELQRVLLAGAVVQAAPILLLDEPTTFLDPAHERLFFEAHARLHQKRALTTVMITHDINNALFQCTHIAALRKGKFIFTGTNDAFRKLCPDILQALYGVGFRSFTCSGSSAKVFGSWGGNEVGAA